MNPTAPAVLPSALIAVLAVIAGLHAYWGFGGRWPGHDEASCAGLVIGKTPGGRMPPPWACFAVSAALAVGTLLVIDVSFGSHGLVPFDLIRSAYGVFAGVFLLRGAAGYVPVLWRPSAQTPFFTLNRRYYSPLCLVLGAGLALNLFAHKL